jgi:hypothetical protein
MNSVAHDEHATRVQLVGYPQQADVLHELICV